MYSICWTVIYLVGRVILLHWSAFFAGLGDYQAQSSLLYIDVFTFKIRVPVSCKFYHLHLPPLTRNPNVDQIFLLQPPLIGHYSSRPIVYTVKTCHCTSFRQGESQMSNNQTTIQTDAPSNHQGPISGDIWWRIWKIFLVWREPGRITHSQAARPLVEFLLSLDFPLFPFFLTGQLKGCIACLHSQDSE